MIERNIFMYWDQGLNSAPEIVQKCFYSWVHQNPDWNVQIYDAHSLPDQIGSELFSTSLEALPVQMRSDLIRLKLLIANGGVWADATCFCSRPLDEWIHQAASGDFFMFARPGRDREIANWFIAARRNSYFLTALLDKLYSFWRNNQLEHDPEKLRTRRKLPSRILSRNRYLPMLWLSPIFTKVLKVYPYFIFHYLFFWTLLTDRKARHLWRHVVKIDAKCAILPQRLGLTTRTDKSGISALEACSTPVYKLNHHVPDSSDLSNTYLEWVLLSHPEGQE